MLVHYYSVSHIPIIVLYLICHYNIQCASVYLSCFVSIYDFFLFILLKIVSAIKSTTQNKTKYSKFPNVLHNHLDIFFSDCKTLSQGSCILMIRDLAMSADHICKELCSTLTLMDIILLKSIGYYMLYCGYNVYQLELIPPELQLIF